MPGGQNEAAHGDCNQILGDMLHSSGVSYHILCLPVQSIRGADAVFEGCRRFSNPDDSVPLDYINTMMVGLLDNLFDKFSAGLGQWQMNTYLSTKHTRSVRRREIFRAAPQACCTSRRRRPRESSIKQSFGWQLSHIREV